MKYLIGIPHADTKLAVDYIFYLGDCENPCPSESQLLIEFIKVRGCIQAFESFTNIIVI